MTWIPKYFWYGVFAYAKSRNSVTCVLCEWALSAIAKIRAPLIHKGLPMQNMSKYRRRYLSLAEGSSPCGQQVVEAQATFKDNFSGCGHFWLNYRSAPAESPKHLGLSNSNALLISCHHELVFPPGSLSSSQWEPGSCQLSWESFSFPVFQKGNGGL